jgi:phage tail sheath protein FI
MMTASDALSYPWVAPAGLTRGVINGLTDLGVNPQQKQRDLLYKISLNPVVFFPNEGYTVFGQKTLLKAPSAFDRINVRRLFLYLEKATLRTMRYFVFEPNTTFTRSRTVNTLSPLFETAKNTQGLYDYLIVCNETNNTANVIDDNTMVVDIYIKPVRTAEFILVNFYATKTSQDFNELLQA